MISCANWEAKFGCDFKGNDFTNKSLPDVSICGNTCISHRECTHFTFTPDGTCWLKKGLVKKEHAIESSHRKTVCGIVLISTVNETQAVFDTNQAFGKENFFSSLFTNETSNDLIVKEFYYYGL